MKKIFGIVVVFLLTFMFLVNTNVKSADKTTYTVKLVKTWMREGDYMGVWIYKYTDQWGGKNYICSYGPPNECVPWSWKAEYPLRTITSPDPTPDYVNTVEWGRDLIITNAAQQGVVIPEDDPIVFTNEIIEIEPN